MPREIVILSPTPPDAEALLRAAMAVDETLRARTLLQGAVSELCQGDGTGDTAVLSVYQPVDVSNTEEIARLLPDAPSMPQPLWWIEALAPWDARGDIGVTLAYELAAQLKGACLVQDGQ